MSENSLYRLLHDCTVRIVTSQNRGSGTGFFVAPSLLITCHHVIKESDVSQIEIHWQRHRYSVLQIVDDSEDLDFVCLEVNIEYHPCVELGKHFKPRDQLYIYGYPGDTIQGESVIARCDGVTDNQIIKMSSETIRGGLSGAPVFNESTQKVCGMVSQSLAVRMNGNTQQGFGGQAIPMSAIVGKLKQEGKISCLNSGSKFNEIDTHCEKIAQNDEPEIPKGMTTQEIYSPALNRAKKVLSILEEQVASYGIRVPVDLLIERDEKLKQVERLESQIRRTQ